MKKFSLKFMKVLLGLLVVIVIGLMGNSWLLIMETSMISDMYGYMRVPVIFLIELSLVALLFALTSGLIVTNQYGKKKVFEAKTKLYLQISSLGFIGSAMALGLLTYYLYLNNLWLYLSLTGGFLALFFLVLSQVAILLADVINKGVALQNEQDLTI